MRTELTVTGNLTADPVTRRTKDDIQVTEFGLAHNDRRLDRTTGLWVDQEATFYTVTCWRRLADGVVSSLHKGDPVVVHGKFTSRQYVRNDGLLRSELKIEADVVGPDLQWVNAGVIRRTPRPAPSVQEAQDPGRLVPVPDIEDDDRGEYGPAPESGPSEFTPAVGN